MKERVKDIIIKVLTWQAQVLLRRHKPTVVAVTGSLGKTGTKDAIASALSAQYSVRKSPKSFNSEFGIPLTILGLPNAWNNPLLWIVNIVRGFAHMMSREYEDVLVLEVGADKPGDIASVAQWLRAEVVVITAVPETPVHVEFYPTADDVLREKAALVEALRETGGVLVTGSDERVSSIDNPYGPVERVDYDASEVLYDDNGLPSGMRFTYDDVALELMGVLGEHQAHAPGCALAVSRALGVSVQGAVDALERAERTPGRMRLIPGRNGSLIIDDSYNSSPEALRAALETLAELEVRGRRIAVLGDMRELGEHTAREHRRAGIRAAHAADMLYTVGPHARTLAEAAHEEGMQESAVHTYDTHEAQRVGQDVAKILQQGDVVLVKSSQGTLRLERAVKEMMAEPERAQELLVRQDSQWMKR